MGRGYCPNTPGRVQRILSRGVGGSTLRHRYCRLGTGSRVVFGRRFRRSSRCLSLCFCLPVFLSSLFRCWQCWWSNVVLFLCACYICFACAISVLHVFRPPGSSLGTFCTSWMESRWDRTRKGWRCSETRPGPSSSPASGKTTSPFELI